MFKKLFYLKKASTVLYPKCYNRNSYDETATVTKKKEGLISYLTVDNYVALYKIADIRHASRRWWIIKKKKRSLKELKRLQKKTLIQHAHSLVLAKENVQLNFHIQQRLQLKALLPFLSVKSYGYLLNLKNSLLQFKEKLNPKIRQNRLKTSCPKNFYILHPIKGGFRAYVGATLGFLARRQLRKIFKLWVKRQNTKQRTLIKARRNLRLDSLILPQPLNIKLLKEFKVQSKFRAAYKKKKFAAAKTKQLRKIVHSKIQFTFTFFRENAWAERQVKRKEKRKEKRQAEGLSNYKRRRK